IGLVLTARILPDTTGFKLVQQMGVESQLQRIPTIMMLSQIDEITLRAGMHIGVKDFLAQPWESETLLNKIRKNLPRRKTVVLIIEYETMICDRLKYIIELKEFKVQTAGTAKEGLEALQQNQIDIVIADIGLPDVPGPALIKEIKAEYPLLPVLLITGLSGRLSQEVARATGADGSISKPFRNLEIIEKLRGLAVHMQSKTSRQPT
ncbi:MAG: response regulator, partial [Planctomycetes bacterium]|nr:response regulator [Planctomycetota bacterium]